MTPTPAERATLAELAAQLAVPFWQTREDSTGLVALCGPRGSLAPGADGLRVRLRPEASASVQEVKQRLTNCGLLTSDLELTRMPTDHEQRLLRELLGLQRGWGK